MGGPAADGWCRSPAIGWDAEEGDLQSDRSTTGSGTRRLPARNVLLSLLAVLALAAVASAQSFLGTIRGTVTDETAAVISGAKVTVSNENTGFSREVTSNASGAFVFAELPVGSYTVVVEYPGRPASRSNILLWIARGPIRPTTFATTKRELSV